MSLLAGLDAHAQRLAGTTIAGLVESDPARARDFALRLGPLYASFARQRYDREALDALFAIAGQADLPAAMRRQLDGETINPTEGRAVLHSALRGDNSTAPVAREARAQAVAAQARMRELIAGLEASEVTDIVSIGIGGSDLGPRLACEALRHERGGGPRVHFLANVDGDIAMLDPCHQQQKPDLERVSRIQCAIQRRISHHVAPDQTTMAILTRPDWQQRS